MQGLITFEIPNYHITKNPPSKVTARPSKIGDSTVFSNRPRRVTCSSAAHQRPGHGAQDRHSQLTETPAQHGPRALSQGLAARAPAADLTHMPVSSKGEQVWVPVASIAVGPRRTQLGMPSFSLCDRLGRFPGNGMIASSLQEKIG